MRGNDFNVALLIYFVPYCLLEVPSNLLLKNISPWILLSTSGLLWGILTICQGFTKSFAGLVVCRFLMGVFESGIFPGCLYLMSMYYKRHELQRRFSVFFCSGSVAGAFGGLLAFGLAKMNGLGGYSGWRWIFIIEGLLTVVVAVACYFLVPDWPASAKFLSTDERQLLLRRLQEDGEIYRMDRLDRKALMLIFKDWKIYLGGIMYLGLSTSANGAAYFIPSILNQFGYSPSQSQLHTIPLYVTCTGTTVITAWASDHLRHRFGLCVGGILFAVIGYAMLLGQEHLSTGARYSALFILISGIYVTMPIVLVWLANNMGGHYKRAVGSGMQIGLGNVGGIIGSTVFYSAQAPKYPVGYGVTIGMLALSALACTIFFVGLRMENKRREARQGEVSSEEDLDNVGDGHPGFRFTM